MLIMDKKDNDDDEVERPYKFLIKVHLMEGKYLSVSNAHVQIKVSVGKVSKAIAAKVSYNAISALDKQLRFMVHSRPSEFFKKSLRIAMYKISSFGLTKKLIGSSSEMPVSSIWKQPNHQIYHKWATLDRADDAEGGTQGYLKCDIVILTEDIEEEIYYEEPPSNNSDIENNLIPYEEEILRRKHAHYTVKIYRADGITWKRKTFQSAKLYKYLYIKVSFGGVTLRTNLCRAGIYPVWNEALHFIGAVPSFHGTINVDMWDRQLKAHVGGVALNIAKLSHYKDDLLSEFGPAFVCLYKENDSSCSAFAGRVLMALESEVTEKATKYQERETIESLDESLLPKYEEFITFFAAFQAIFFNRKFTGQKIILDLTHGADSYEEEKNPTLTPYTLKGSVSHSSLMLHVPKIADWNYGYGIVERIEVAPTAFVMTSWPDINSRVHIKNRLKKCLNDFSDRLDKCKKQAEMGVSDSTVKEYKLALKILLDGTNEFLQLDDLNSDGLVNKLSMLRNSLKSTLCLSKSRFMDNLCKASFIEELENCIEDSNTMFPNIRVTVYKKDREVSCFTVQSENIFHSNLEEERGTQCGKLQTVWLMDPKQKNHIAVFELFMWFGPKNVFSSCAKLLSLEGSEPPSEISLPERHYFQLRVHIYEANFYKGEYPMGLTDSYVRILAFGQYRETQVQRNTLYPVWDETLNLASLCIPGEYHFIKRESCAILVEVIDNDTHSSTSVIGRAFVRPNVVLKDEKYKAPQMKWQTIQVGGKNTGQVLMASEWVETPKDDTNVRIESEPVPENIRPHYVECRLEVIFWGLRNMKYFDGNKLFIIVECNGVQLESNVVPSARNVDFNHVVQFTNIQFPEESEFSSTITVSLYEIAWLKKSMLIGSSSCSSRAIFLSYTPKRFIFDIFKKSKREPTAENDEKPPLVHNVTNYMKDILQMNESNFEIGEEGGVLDWWTRYYAVKNKTNPLKVCLLKIYTEELELQPGFNQFHDFIAPLDLSAAKNKINKSVKFKKKDKFHLGVFKGAMKIYTKEFSDTELQSRGYFANYPTVERREITVRVYVIAATDLLYPSDCNPYVILNLGRQKLSDKANYVYKDNNPLFGKMFEFKGMLPWDNTLRIRIMDHGTFLSDQLIGQTLVDIENRFYSKHRASCGIPAEYEHWRDQLQPFEILKRLCKIARLGEPTFSDNDNLNVGGKVFRGVKSQEEKALEALKKFQQFPNGFPLVPEHLETRFLSHPEKLDETGKLEMWIDIFSGHTNIPPAINVEPRKALYMELRVVVWSTENVPLVDKNSITGEKSSDIYVKGWLASPQRAQETDVHYRSINGQASFNWRLIFRFIYSSAERKIMVKRNEIMRKSHLDKVPCILEIQVLNKNDIIADAHLGTLRLDLLDMPPGARNAKQCNLKMFEAHKKRINLFRIRKIRAWWPFRSQKDNEHEVTMAGKVDLELELVDEEEARTLPAGRGRDGPKKLPKPYRPNQSMFQMPIIIDMPLKFLKRLFGFINYKKLVTYILIGLVILLIIMCLMALPNLIMQKIINAF